MRHIQERCGRVRKIGEFVIKAKVGNGISTYRFDQKDYALEIVKQLNEEGIVFETNFAYETPENE